jgi:hypothetical protein
MNNLIVVLKNWQTTALGLSAIVVALGNILHDLGSGVPLWTVLSNPNAGIFLGGLAGVAAKDANK